MDPSRWLVIDDTDPRIAYHNSSGNSTWSPIQTDTQAEIPTGPYFNNTLHSGPPGGVQLSFNFSGTYYRVYISTAPGAAFPLQSSDICAVDNIPTLTHDATDSDKQLNNVLLCMSYDIESLEDKEHSLRVASSPTETLLFDRVVYAPSTHVPLENETILVENYDNLINYGPGWEEVSEWHQTSQTNTTLDFSFIGVSLAWYWVILNGDPRSPTSATYTIDGGPPQLVNVSSTSEPVLLGNRKLFEIFSLPMAEHTLSLKYHGDSEHLPLTLDFLLIQNGSFPTTTPLSSPTPSPSNEPMPGDQNQASNIRNHTGAIVGGLLGCILLVLLLLGILCYRRRRKRPAREEIVEPFPLDTPIATPTTTTKSLGSETQHTQDTVTTSIHPCGCPTTPADPSLKPQQPDRSDTHASATHICLPLPFALSSKGPQENSDERGSQQIIPAIVVHADSGLRLPVDDLRQSVVELPPVYSHS